MEKVNYTDGDIVVVDTLDAISQALRFSDRSIKEIAVDFGFTNLSTFGKFVKDNLGDSPRAFRRAKVC